MLRSTQLKTLFVVQSPTFNSRFFSAQTAKATSSNFKEEWNNAKPYESVPKLTKLQAIRSFLPGG